MLFIVCLHTETDSTRAGAVILGDGKKIYADFIVIGVGVKPATVC